MKVATESNFDICRDLRDFTAEPHYCRFIALIWLPYFNWKSFYSTYAFSCELPPNRSAAGNLFIIPHDGCINALICFPILVSAAHLEAFDTFQAESFRWRCAQRVSDEREYIIKPKPLFRIDSMREGACQKQLRRNWLIFGGAWLWVEDDTKAKYSMKFDRTQFKH